MGVALKSKVGVLHFVHASDGAVMNNLLLSRQQQAINNAETVLAEISLGNPAEEESSTTVQRLVVELNKYL